MTVGTKVSYANTTTAVRSVVNEIDLMSVKEVPFLKRISGGDEENPSLASLSADCRATKYEWIEDEDFALETTLGAAVADTSTTSLTLAAGDVGKVNEGMILLVDDEQMRVTATTGSSPITVARGWGGTTAATHSDGAAVLVVGRVHEEGADAPSAIYSYPTMPYNYVQEITDTIKLSEIEQAIQRYGIDNAVEFETQKRTRELMRLVERQCFYGKRVAFDSGVPGSFGGLETFIPAANIVDASGGALTTTHINTVLQTIYQTAGRNMLPDTILVGAWGKRKISSLYGLMTGVTNNRDIAERRGGVIVDVIQHDFGGTIDVMLSPWQPKDKVYLLRMDEIGIGPLQGKAFAREMLAKTGTSDKWMISGSYTLEVRKSKCHGLIDNISLAS